MIKPPREEDWVDVTPINAFTSRNTVMYNLNVGKVVQHYSANTKIVVVQKYVSESGTYYRTASAKYNNLNWAFEAPALGLPNEKAPSAPSQEFFPLSKKSPKTTPKKRKTTSAKKQTTTKTAVGSKDGEGQGRHLDWVSKLFRRKNG